MNAVTAYTWSTVRVPGRYIGISTAIVLKSTSGNGKTHTSQPCVPLPPERRGPENGESFAGAQGTPCVTVPWHIEQFPMKTGYPCLAVPLPGGKPFPEGPAVQARFPMSALVAVVPIPL